MVNKKRIQIEIEKWKDEKENRKYAWDKIMYSQFTILAIFVSMIIGLISTDMNLYWKVGVILGIVFLIIISYFILQNIANGKYKILQKLVNVKNKRMEQAAGKIQSLYDELLK